MIFSLHVIHGIHVGHVTNLTTGKGKVSKYEFKYHAAQQNKRNYSSFVKLGIFEKKRQVRAGK